MSDADFYRVLGVTPSASADQIKAAYRELVKKYHPDLFPTAGAKAEATEKLRVINEAYSILGNPKRRDRYDRRFIQILEESSRVRAEGRRGTARFRPRAVRTHIHKIQVLKHALWFSKKRMAYVLVAAALVLTLVYASRSEPRLVIAYSLFEKLEVSPAKDASQTEDGWKPLGQYASLSECGAKLKEKVREDEQDGSRAVFGDPNGTMAITVLVKRKTAPVRQDSSAGSSTQSAVNESFAQPDQNPTGETSKPANDGMMKRVRNLECRATQRLISESWLSRLLR